LKAAPRGSGRFAHVCDRRWLVAGAVFLFGLLAALPAQAQWAAQSIALTSQWNAVYLNIDPFPAVCDTVFASLPRVQSVRQWNPRSQDDVYYDETAGSVLPQGGSWLTWFPPAHTNRPLLDLYEMEGGRAYLIEVSPGSQISVTLTGRPIAIAHGWLGGTYHLLGLPVPAAPAVDFTEFLTPAAPAIPVLFPDGGEIYKVRADGTHERVFQPTLTDIEPGRAYWIKANFSTEYSGPIGVRVEAPGGWIDFGNRLVPQYLEIDNKTDTQKVIRIQHLTSAAPPAGAEPLAGKVPLRYAVVTPEEGLLGRQYLSLPNTWSNTVPAGGTVRLALLPDASQLSGASNTAFQSVLTVSDDATGPGTVVQRVGVRVAARSGTLADAAGLWVGEATIAEVSRVQMLGLLQAIPTYPIPAARPFSFRLIAHVDSNGTARLLQRALIGTRRDPGTDDVVVDILADESLAAGYRALHPEAGFFRVSSANFPFMAPVTLTGGGFGVPLNTVEAVVDMSRDDPVNPFLHATSPLHDNKERRAESDVPYDEDIEVYTVNRHIEMLFQPPDANNPDPKWGVTACGGVYREDIYGLGGDASASNRVIKVEGTFRLEKAVSAGALMQ
jgi:hypothetical protein